MSEIQDEAYSEACQEIDRLKKRVFQLEAIIEFGSVRTLEEYESLLSRAADALEDWVSALPLDVATEDKDLIAELREAAK